MQISHERIELANNTSKSNERIMREQTLKQNT